MCAKITLPIIDWGYRRLTKFRVKFRRVLLQQNYLIVEKVITVATVLHYQKPQFNTKVQNNGKYVNRKSFSSNSPISQLTQPKRRTKNPYVTLYPTIEIVHTNCSEYIFLAINKVAIITWAWLYSPFTEHNRTSDLYYTYLWTPFIMACL